MNTLRKLIREAILLESAKSINDALEAGVIVRVDRSSSRGDVYITLNFPRDEQSPRGLFGVRLHSKAGIIQVGSPHSSSKFGGGPCEPKDKGGSKLPPAWEVKWSSAPQGWGPLIYDIAIEVCRVFGASLTSDRDEVSDEAQNVWRYYDRNRTDVLKGQLDDEVSTLTQDPSDDCSQDMARAAGPHPSTWASSPLSRAFTVPDGHYPRLRKLIAAGKLDDRAGIKKIIGSD